MNEFAFVLGNGQSRLEFDTGDLQSRGTVFACNRMYTNKHVDVLVSVDEGMTKEIQNHELFWTFKEHYTRPQYTNNTSLPLDKRWQGYSSGPNAAAIAATKGFAYICLIGMDLHSDTSYINNIYAGTEHYKGPDDGPTFYGNWVDQLVHIAEVYNHIRFIHVNPLKGFTPDEWKQMSNFSVMTKPEFQTFVGMDK
jgi:hypothetical protein